MCSKLISLVSLVLVLGLAWTSSAKAADPGLVGWWKFDEGAGAVAADSSGHGMDGVLGDDPVWRDDGVHNKCLFFDGDLAHVRIAHQDSLNPADGSFSFAFWANMEVARGANGSTVWDLAVNKRDVGSQGYYIGANRDQGSADQAGYKFMLGNTAGNRVDTPYLLVPLAEWVFVAAVLDRDLNEHKISVDGGQTWATAIPPSGSIAPAEDLGIGWDIGINNYWFHGRIDDVRLYNWPLSANELLTVMEGGEGFPLARRPDPADGAVLGATWVNLTWVPGSLAVSHDLYFGASFDDVNDGAEATFVGSPATSSQVVGFTGFPAPDGLVPGTTYYWRVDEVNDADPNSPWKGDVWSFAVQPKIAHDPVPPDGARFIDTDITLGWTAGFEARLHTVYFGDNFDDVSAASGGVSQTDTTYVPGPLEFGATYYWRVDEFDAITTHKGDVWSFATRPAISIADPNLVGWWKFDEGSGTTALDWSGHDNHATLVDGPQWVEGRFGGALEFGGSNYATMDPVADDITGNNVTLSGWVKTTDTHGLWLSCNTGGRGNVALWSIDLGLATMYDGSESVYEGYSDTVVSDDEWHMLTYVRSGDTGYIYVDGFLENTHAAGYSFGATDLWSIAMEWDAGGASDFLVGIVDDVRIYNMAMAYDQVVELMRGDPLLAWNPSPADNSTSDVVRAASLSWSPGDSASQHAVYFGTDRDAVNAADTSDTTGVFKGLQVATSYAPPEGVESAGGPYYWRIDQHSTDGTVTKGNTWKFAVADYILVEDFEPYNDIPAGEPGSNLVYVTWADGFDNPTANGSTMGYVTGVSLETGNVHGGRQSAPLAYNNTAAALSEVTRTLASQNWTTHGVKTLGLWFHGAGGNTGKLYVKVNGSKVTYDGDPADMQRGWQAWNIELASFGANLQSVTSLVIGVEGTGATGTLLLDDIRLYALPRELITPVQPGPAGLVGHWALDGNVQDSSGLGNHGTVNCNPTYALGRIGQAMTFDGFDDYVAIDGVTAGITNDDITLAGWVRTADTDNVYWLSCNGPAGSTANVVLFGILSGQLAIYDTSAAEGHSSVLVNDSEWHHLAYSRSGSTGSIYIDGNLEKTHTANFTFTDPGNRWSIGQEWDDATPSNFLAGTVDDVRIYDVGLSYAEIAALAGRTLPFDKPF